MTQHVVAHGIVAHGIVAQGVIAQGIVAHGLQVRCDIEALHVGREGRGGCDLEGSVLKLLEASEGIVVGGLGGEGGGGREGGEAGGEGASGSGRHSASGDSRRGSSW